MLEYLTHIPPLTVPTPYRQHESVKRCQYEERVRGIEHGTLVLSFQVAWVLAYKHLALLLSCKWKTPYCNVMRWLRCHLDFSLLQLAIICIRGCRSSSGNPLKGHILVLVDLTLGRDAFELSKPPFHSSLLSLFLGYVVLVLFV